MLSRRDSGWHRGPRGRGGRGLARRRAARRGQL